MIECVYIVGEKEREREQNKISITTKIEYVIHREINEEGKR
jgi:hypothetical protein